MECSSNDPPVVTPLQRCEGGEDEEGREATPRVSPSFCCGGLAPPAACGEANTSPCSRSAPSPLPVRRPAASTGPSLSHQVKNDPSAALLSSLYLVVWTEGGSYWFCSLGGDQLVLASHPGPFVQTQSVSLLPPLTCPTHLSTGPRDAIRTPEASRPSDPGEEVLSLMDFDSFAARCLLTISRCSDVWGTKDVR